MKACLVLTLIVSTRLFAQQWQRSDETDAFRGTKYIRFKLEGKFLTPPKSSTIKPTMIVDCLPSTKPGKIYRGNFLAGFVVTGALITSIVGEKTTVLGGTSLRTFIPVQYRLDGGKIKDANWSPSTDGTSVFFPETAFATLLYGHYLPHKEGSGEPTHKVTLALDEYLGREIVIEFQMPDPTEPADACGQIRHKLER